MENKELNNQNNFKDNIFSLENINTVEFIYVTILISRAFMLSNYESHLIGCESTSWVSKLQPASTSKLARHSLF